MLRFVLFASLMLPSLASAQEPIARILFGSCNHQDKPQEFWDPILALKPQLFLYIGDNIYGDTQDMELMRAKYTKLGASEGFQKLRAACPMLATWDDHDYGVDDGGADYPKRKESQKEFLDFFKVPQDSPRRNQEGVYNAQIFGPADKSVQVILLDTRYHRSKLNKKEKFVRSEGPYIPSNDPEATFLGEAQWKWLGEQLKQPAKVRILVSSIQVVAEDHHFEKWANIPRERDRLFQLIKDTGASGLFMLSGDRHLAELSMMDAGIGYPLYDMTASGLNQAFKNWRKQEVNRHRVASMNFGNHFGAIFIDWSRADPLIALQIRDEASDIIIQQKIPLSLLQPGVLANKGKVKLAAGELLTNDEIKKRMNLKIEIEMTVNNVGQSANGMMIFLNSADRLSEDNFTVVLDKAAQDSLKNAGITAPKTQFDGQTLRVRGLLSSFRDRPQIIVSDAAQIEILKK